MPRVSRGARFLPAVQVGDAAGQLPEEALHHRALLQPEDAELEHLERLLLLGGGVVVGLGPVARGEALHDLAHLAHDLRLAGIGLRGGGDLLLRPDLDVPEDVHDDAGVVGGDRAPRLRDDVGLGHPLVHADALHVVDDVADVLLHRVVHGRGVAVRVGAHVVHAEAAAHVEVLDGEPHLAELRVDPRRLVHRVLHHADLGELRADVEVEELRALLLARLLQDLHRVDELGDGEPELREVAGRALPLPRAARRELRAQADHGLDAHLVGEAQELRELGELLDDDDDLAAELAAEEGEAQELLVLVAVADGERLGVGVHAEDDEELALRARLEPVVVRRAGVEDLLDHLAHLVHLDRVHAEVAGAVGHLGDRLPERLVDLLHAGAEHVLEADHAGEADLPLLDVLDHVHEVDGRAGLSHGVDDDVPLVVHREVAGSPPGDVVVLGRALDGPVGRRHRGRRVAASVRNGHRPLIYDTAPRKKRRATPRGPVRARRAVDFAAAVR